MEQIIKKYYTIKIQNFRGVVELYEKSNGRKNN